MTFFQNLWRDLVDKKLWPVAVALLLAAVAVPLLIDTGSSETTAAAPAVQPAPTDTTADVTVAVTDTTKARSRSGEARDPFKPLVFAKTAKTPATGTTSASTAKASTGSVKPLAASTPSVSKPSTSTSSSPSPSAVKPTRTTPSVTKPSPTTPSRTTPSTTTTTKTTRFEYALSLQTKRSGKTTTRKDVRAVSYVPSADYPLLAFIGVRPDGKSATFLVSEGVTVKGNQRECRPSWQDCRYLELTAGKSVLIAKTPPAGQQIRFFRLTLNAVRTVPVKAIGTDATRAESRAAIPNGIVGAAVTRSTK